MEKLQIFGIAIPAVVLVRGALALWHEFFNGK